jgi:hypothetical protein
MFIIIINYNILFCTVYLSIINKTVKYNIHNMSCIDIIYYLYFNFTDNVILSNIIFFKPIKLKRQLLRLKLYYLDKRIKHVCHLALYF